MARLLSSTHAKLWYNVVTARERPRRVPIPDVTSFLMRPIVVKRAMGRLDPDAAYTLTKELWTHSDIQPLES